MSVVGVAFTLFALFAFLSARDLEQNGQRTQGVVIDLVSKKPTGQQAGYAPLVEWQMPDGSSHRFKGSIASHPPAYSVGQNVTVLYRAGDPSSAAIDGAGQRFLLPFLFGSMGLVFSFLGLSKLIPFWRRKAA